MKTYKIDGLSYVVFALKSSVMYQTFLPLFPYLLKIEPDPEGLHIHSSSGTGFNQAVLLLWMESKDFALSRIPSPFAFIF